MNENFWDGHGGEFEAKQVVDKIAAAVAEFRPRAPPRESFPTAAKERKNCSIVGSAAEFPPPSLRLAISIKIKEHEKQLPVVVPPKLNTPTENASSPERKILRGHQIIK